MEPTSILTGGINWTGFFSSAGLVVFYMLFLGVLGVLGYLFYNYVLLYNQKVIIFQALNNTWTIHTDRARITKKRSDLGQPFLQLLKSKRELPPVSRKEYGLIRTLFGRQDCLMFYTTDDFKTLLPVRFVGVTEEKALNVLDEWNASMIHLNEHKRQDQKFQQLNALQKYAHFILPIATMVICFAMVLITLKYVNDISGNANSAAQMLGDAIRLYKSAPTPAG